MLRTLKNLFDSLLAPADAQGAAAGPHLQLATAVLLVEVMRADTEMSDDERRAVLVTLRQRFALAGDASERLVELAERTSRQATDLHAFTTALNAQLSFERKVEIVQAMWQVAYADGHLEAHEKHVLWRVADLLHVPHGAYIGAKMRAKALAEGATPPTQPGPEVQP